MFSVKKSSNPAIRSKRQFTDRGAKSAEELPRLGRTSRQVSEKLESTSSNVSMKVSGAPNTTISGNAITIDVDPMLTGMTPANETVLHRVFRDIYYNDVIGGSAVDLITLVAFGDFSLGGLSHTHAKTSEKVREAFHENMERLSIRTFVPEAAVDYLVLGEHCSSLLYNREHKTFTDVFPHTPEDLTVKMLPFYSQEPLINVKFPEDVRSLFGNVKSPRIQRLMNKLGTQVVEQIKAGSLELDPLSTIYIPRKTFTKSDRGTSYFRRLLPIYLIEKNLFRGTLVESARRQRGILHLSLGDGDTWIPTVQDMEFMTELFMNADSDPIGAIIATRMGVQVDELRQGGDFWKSTDFADSVLGHKCRALTISEGLLSGEANFNTADQSLTIFLEMIRSFREVFTRKLFYDKLFPLISLINGFTLDSKGRVSVKDGLMNSLDSEEAMFKLNDGSKLFIPNVHWTKQLKPEGDSSYMDMLNSLTEKGVPVPLRVLAAAGGMDLDMLLRQQQEDLDIRKKIADYKKEIDALAPKSADMESESASLLALANADPTGRTKSAVISAGGRRIPLLDRDFGESGMVTDSSKTGKARHVVNQKAANDRVNRMIARAAAKLQTKRIV